MAITGTPTTIGDDIVTVTPTGSYSIDAQAGNDKLVLDFSSLGADIGYTYVGSGYYRYTDGVRTTVDFLNFERYDITGGAGADLLVGGALADRLVGNAGNDRFEGGLGADTIIGGTGMDRWVADYSTFASAVSLDLLGVGVSTVVGSGATLSAVEAISLSTGAGADVINTAAYSANDDVSTAAGNDYVALGRGVDSAHGGDDIDTLRMDWSGMTDPNAGIGNSYVGSGWYRYGNGADRLDYQGFERYDLIGGAGGDVLYGAALNDTLAGNAGNDLLASGGGVDNVSGGDGIDIWRVDTSARPTATIINLQTQTTNYGAVLAGIERIEFTGGNGPDQVTALAGVYNDSISTGNGNDLVSTGRGVDSADGGAGTVDKLVMDWSAISDPRQGISLSYVGSDWWRYQATSGDRLDFRYFETYELRGGAGDDALTGGALNDTLIGNGGDDTLNGGIGDGIFDGGAGNDLWTADLSAQSIALFDAIASQTAAQVTGLGLSVSAIERLSLTTGNFADVISTEGYALNDYIGTSGGNDKLNGGLGFDTLDGGSGSDIMTVNYATATSAVSNVYVGSGFNRYQMADGTARVDWINMERFALTGGLGNDSLNGGASGDTLIGNNGDDVLNGNRGMDSIVGGAGRDTYIGDYSNLATAVTLTLTAAGSGTIGGVGTKLATVENISLSTGAGADVINLAAATGSDTLATGNGDDVVNLGRGIYESVDLGLGIDTLTLDASLATAGLHEWYIGSGYTRIQATDGSYTADMAGVDHLNVAGSAYSDHLYGFDLSDTLNGKAGTDFLDGGKGDDILIGGTGADLFIFSDLYNAGHDQISDFSAGDLIRLSGYTVTGSVGAGNGSTMLTGGVQVSSAGGVSTLHIGLDATAGADLHIDITGSFAGANFLLSGSDILFV